MSHTYFANFISGLQKFVLAELQQKLDNVSLLAQNREHVVFRYPGNPRALLQLRSVEELYVCLQHLRGVDRSRTQVHRIELSARKANLRQAITIAQKIGFRWRGRLRVRVRAKMEGRHNFRRVDTQYAVERGLLKRQDRLCKLDRDHPHSEICVETRGEETYLLWRLTDESFRQHGEKWVHLPASLRPTVAYAMVQQSQPHPGDIFLDPMCGAGTILLERARSEYYRYLLGGDLEWQAIQAAVANIGPRHKPRSLFHWNALKLPLGDYSVDKIVCNLPFGKQITLPHPDFYKNFLREASRVLRPEGRMVLLVSDRKQLVSAAQKTHWKIQTITPVTLLGQRSFIVSATTSSSN